MSIQYKERLLMENVDSKIEKIEIFTIKVKKGKKSKNSVRLTTRPELRYAPTSRISMNIQYRTGNVQL